MKNVLLFSLLVVITCCKQEISDRTNVYITSTGNKYHLSSCRYLGKSAVPVLLDDAETRGYEPCSECNPPQYKAAAFFPENIEAAPHISTASIINETIFVQCAGVTNKGQRCKRKTKNAEGKCFQHNK